MTVPMGASSAGSTSVSAGGVSPQAKNVIVRTARLSFRRLFIADWGGGVGLYDLASKRV